MKRKRMGRASRLGISLVVGLELAKRSFGYVRVFGIFFYFLNFQSNEVLVEEAGEEKRAEIYLEIVLEREGKLE